MVATDCSCLSLICDYVLYYLGFHLFSFCLGLCIFNLFSFTSHSSTTTVTVVSIIFSIVAAIGIYATEIMPDIDEKEQISKERNIP